MSKQTFLTAPQLIHSTTLIVHLGCTSTTTTLHLTMLGLNTGPWGCSVHCWNGHTKHGPYYAHFAQYAPDFPCISHFFGKFSRIAHVLSHPGLASPTIHSLALCHLVTIHTGLCHTSRPSRFCDTFSTHIG